MILLMSLKNMTFRFLLLPNHVFFSATPYDPTDVLKKFQIWTTLWSYSELTLTLTVLACFEVAPSPTCIFDRVA